MERRSRLDRGITTYIGAENVFSPLGENIDDNFKNALEGKSGLKDISNLFGDSDSFYVASLEHLKGDDRFFQLALKTINGSLKQVDPSSFTENWLLIISTTKGDIDQLESGNFRDVNNSNFTSKLKKQLPFNCDSEVISLACISGLASVINASDHIQLKNYDHVLVLGIDVLSRFTTKGFESFYALDRKQCQPFDQDRRGLNLGEAAASVVVSSKIDVFKNPPIQYLGGTTSNDANHISGPSRTGEGLVIAINKSLNRSKTSPSSIDYISAHGTGTRYNDDMESIAFTRTGLAQVPINSLKGYYGHSLGASSLIEIAMGAQSIKNNTVLPTYGCINPGTSKNINIATSPIKKELITMLKTASGFGGCNAAAIFKKL